MEKFLEIAIREIEQGEIDNAIDSLEEAEYAIREIEADEEVLELILDARDTLLVGDLEKGLLYTNFALDVLTLTECEGYEYGEDIPDLLKEMVELKARNPIGKLQRIQHEIEVRRLEGKIVKTWTADHERRFGVRLA